MCHSHQALASAQQSFSGEAQPPGYKATLPTPVPEARMGRCLRFGVWRHESGPDHMTSLTVGTRGIPPACLPQAKHGAMPSLLSLAYGSIYCRSRHMPPLSFPWHTAEISNQTQCFITTKLFAHLTPHLARPHGSTGQMLEERTGPFNSIFHPSKTGHLSCLSPSTTHGRHC